VTHNDDAYRLLSEYAAGNLTEAERNRLAQEALADHAVFEAMVEEEAIREALEDKVFRRRVKERLRELGAEGDPLLTRIFQYLVTPKGMITAGGALAAIAITLLVQFGLLKPSGALIQVNLGPPNGPTATAASVAGEPVTSESKVQDASRAQPPPSDSHAILQLDRPGRHPTYRIGDRQRIGFRLDQAANAIVWEELSSGPSYRLFPNRYQSSPLVEKGKTVLIPPPGQGDLSVQGPAGPRVLRLLILPPDRNPLDPANSWDELKRSAKEVRLVYEVKDR
jgi:hypothetical protein